MGHMWQADKYVASRLLHGTPYSVTRNQRLIQMDTVRGPLNEKMGIA